MTNLSASDLAAVHAEGHAERALSPFENPMVINQYQRVLSRRGEPWAESVLGRSLRRRSLTWGPWLEPGEPEILVLADKREAELAAPLPVPHPMVTFINAINGARLDRCYPDDAAASIDEAVYWPFNNTRTETGTCHRVHNIGTDR